MQSYKITVSKNGKKYTIVFKAENEILARERVHKEGYFILSIEEQNEKTEIGNIFLFSAKNNLGEIKQGKIVGDDIFKVYVKLRKNLEYDVMLLYSEADNLLSQEDKEKIVKNLDEEYNLYYNSSKNTQVEEKHQIKEVKENVKDKIDSFYMKKELDETYKLINRVLEKLQSLINGENGIVLDLLQKEKIKNIYNSIIKYKSTTNIAKLKEIGELALLKIGNIELEDLEKKHNNNTRELLKETNYLLKKVGSKESFIEKEKDINYILSNFFAKITNIVNLLKSFNTKKVDVDKHSHSYIKNMLFLKKYKEKLKENWIYMLKNFFVLLFNSEKRTDAFIRRRVLKENITLFNAKEKGVSFSYTFAKKGKKLFLEYLFSFINKFRVNLFFVIFIYVVIFLVNLNLQYYNIFLINTNFVGIFYFIIILFIYVLLFISRNIIILLFNFVFLYFIIIFGVVNF